MRGVALMLVAMLAGCAGGSPDERSVSAPPVPASPRESAVFRPRTLEASCADLATARCSDFVLCASFEDRARFFNLIGTDRDTGNNSDCRWH